MKPRLTVLLGAGSTMDLGIGPEAVRIGVAGTDEITKQIARHKFPAAFCKGVPFVIDDKQEKPFYFGQVVPVLPLLYRALKATYEVVDFELMLHALEQIEPLISTEAPLAVLSAFVEIGRKYDVLTDRNLLRATRFAVVEQIHRLITQIEVGRLAQRPAILEFFERLAQEFQVSAFTLIYDDIIDGASLPWFDGFTGGAEQSGQGSAWEAKSLDATSFENWQHRSEPLLVHLHGSVRFGYSIGDFGLRKYGSAQAAIRSLQGISRSDTYIAGQIVTGSPIISGLSKAAKLVHNPAPFGYYYKAFMDAMLMTDRLLVIGYGGRDDHINTWLSEFSRKFSVRKAVWIGKLSGKMVGERTPEKEMIQLVAGGGFQDFLHYDDPENPNRMHQFNALALVPSGFPISAEIEGQIFAFLGNS
jgi:hypothetical protein